MQDRKVRALVIASTLGALVASTACQSSSTNVVGPGGEKCAIALPQNLPSIGAEGGTGTLQINVAAECVWSVSSGAEWIAITSNNSGQGSGVVNFAAASNPAASVRRGAVIVSDRRVELMQAAAACQFNLSPATASIGSNGDEGDITVTVADGCQWSATSQAPWLSVVSGQSGTGAGSVRYRVDANSSAAAQRRVDDWRSQLHRESRRNGWLCTRPRQNRAIGSRLRRHRRRQRERHG